MRELICKKLGMSRIFREDGLAIPVTVIEAGPNVVVSLRDVEKDGYVAAQVGFGERRKNLFNKAQLGQFEKAGVAPLRNLCEIKYEDELKVGDTLTADLFKIGDIVDVMAQSKGLGFQGVVRRHGFKGGQRTHGQSDRLRAPGSIGQSSYPSRVFKGVRMGGHMGAEKVTVIGLQVVRVTPEKNIILLSGATPGKKGTVLRLRSSSRVKNASFVA
ncbi:MAG: 50S ribosomal protein L3 [candidate division Zixibacteria bacterium]|nr:50S ribosomal protein L3 [candidate division Zixibacteria bacterium]